MAKVEDISLQATMARLLQENALAALIIAMSVLISLLVLVNGIVIGYGMQAIVETGEKYDALRAQTEIHNIYEHQLVTAIKASNYDLPLPPKPKE